MKRYLIFAAIGPFIGGFLLLVATTVASGYWAESSPGEVAKFLGAFFRTLPFSYLFGIVPALMVGAIDDILFHVRRISPALRVAIMGAVGFAIAQLLYGQRGPDTGAALFMLYGLIGLTPAVLSSWLAHRYADEPQPVHAA
ncbi:MAG: DUF5413 family protein [bacterium]|nr:DUF5413 family protein [bacterium]